MHLIPKTNLLVQSDLDCLDSVVIPLEPRQDLVSICADDTVAFTAGERQYYEAVLKKVRLSDMELSLVNTRKDLKALKRLAAECGHVSPFSGK